MRGLAIQLDHANSGIEMREASGFDLSIQNCLVNLGQRKGTSAVFPDKGVSILGEALSGGVVSPGSANRLGGLAAIQTLLFVNKHELPGIRERVSDLSVIPEVFDQGRLTFQVSVKSSLDRVVGVSVGV